MVSISDLNRDVPPDTSPEDDPQFVSLAESGSIVETLSSATRRCILTEVCAEPTNAAALAERVDTSIQNVRYHLDTLETAGLVTVEGTYYSDKGLKMDVYGATSTVIVIAVDGQDDTEDDPTNDQTIGPPVGIAR